MWFPGSSWFKPFIYGSYSSNLFSGVLKVWALVFEVYKTTSRISCNSEILLGNRKLLLEILVILKFFLGTENHFLRFLKITKSRLEASRSVLHIR